MIYQLLLNVKKGVLNVFDNEIEKINEKYQGLIDAIKKERDKKVY